MPPITPIFHWFSNIYGELFMNGIKQTPLRHWFHTNQYRARLVNQTSKSMNFFRRGNKANTFTAWIRYEPRALVWTGAVSGAPSPRSGARRGARSCPCRSTVRSPGRGWCWGAPTARSWIGGWGAEELASCNRSCSNGGIGGRFGGDSRRRRALSPWRSRNNDDDDDDEKFGILWGF